MNQPNILLIMTDQMRGDCLGIAGHPDVKTPYLDTLASQGVWFDNAYSACPSCIAARAALHTGMSQEHHRRVGYQDGIPWRYEHTIAKELSKNGYYTQCVGKMHVHPLRNYLGFHHVELHDGYMGYYRRAVTPYAESQFVADDYFYWLQEQKGAGADLNVSGVECNSWVARPFPYEEKYHPTNWVTDRSIDFLRRRDPDMPFFLMASYVRPHSPFDAPACYFDMYKDKKLEPPHVGNWENENRWKNNPRSYDSIIAPTDPELIRQMQVGYYACITHLDHQIGRLIMALQEQGLYYNTVIMFVSDHGEQLGDHHYFRKSLPYQGSVRVPFLISGNPALTGMVPHSVCHNVVELRDVMPTILDIAQAEIPDSVDGKSVLPLIQPDSRESSLDEVGEESTNFREYLHGEHAYGDLSNHYIVTEDEKYCWFSKTGEEQYFDLKKDPHEKKNRIQAPKYQERIARLRSCLIQELKDRPEGFVEDDVLVAGKECPAYIPDIPKSSLAERNAESES